MTSTALTFEALRFAGYGPGAPTAITARMDRAMCDRSTCEACGHVGAEYHPFFRAEPRSYRAFAVCRRCGETTEF